MKKTLKDISWLKAGGMLSVIGVVFVASLYLVNISMTPVVEYGHSRDHWVEHPLGDADPGSGNTGFMYFMVYPHQADPGTAYASNLSNASAYEFSDSTDVELTGETPYSTTFDFVMKVRVNNSDGYNSSGASWEDGWVRANLTCDFDFASDISDLGMTEVVIATAGTTYRWYHYYVNNGGSGYTIVKGELFNCTSVTFDVYE